MKNKLVLILSTVVTIACCFQVKGYQINIHNSYCNVQNIVDHSTWNKLLNTYVTENGNVNYKGFKNDIETLNSYIHYLSTQVPSEQWSKQEKLAYFINVYNAHTIKLIVDNYPTKSIKDIGNAWSKKLMKIGNDRFSLSNIEHDILRKMDEPRIHFAINCASKSCPKLMNVAFTAENMEHLLEQATDGFINNSNKNKLSEKKVRLSKLFKWYKEDFTKNGNLIDYINQYSTVKIDSDASVSYLEYDWDLNEQN